MFLSLFLFIILLAELALSANEIGLIATVSISSQSSYILGRTCAACCVWYNGGYPPDTQGYYDLAVALSCGADAVNGCYCKVDYASSASSCVSSCVSSRCSAIGDVTKDLETMMDLYDNYCKTANVEVSITPTAIAASTEAASKRAISTGAASTEGPLTRISIITTSFRRDVWISSIAQLFQTSSPSGAASTTGMSNSPVLGRSDTVPIGVGLGIGVSSLLLGLATFCDMSLSSYSRKNKMLSPCFLSAFSAFSLLFPCSFLLFLASVCISRRFFTCLVKAAMLPFMNQNELGRPQVRGIYNVG